MTSVSKSMADVNRPSGVRCHGPSAKSGWFGYSRYERSSLATSPGLISCLPLRLSTRLAIPPPRDGSTDSAKVSFSMASVSTARQPASSSGVEPGSDVERPVADGGHVAGQEGDRRPAPARPPRADRPIRPRTGRARRHRRRRSSPREPSSGRSTSTRAMSVRDHDSALKTVTAWPSPAVSICGGQVLDGAVEDGRAELERLAPATDEVEVDLVRFGAGDPVVVGTEQELSPGLVDRLGREPGTASGPRSWRTSRRPRSVFSAARCICLVSMNETSLPV